MYYEKRPKVAHIAAWAMPTWLIVSYGAFKA